MKDDRYIGRRMELSGKRKWGRPKRRCVDAVREDMAVAEVTEEDTEGKEQLEMENPLWRPPKGEAKRRQRRVKMNGLSFREWLFTLKPRGT